MKEKEKVYLRRLTYSEVKYGYLRIVKKYCDQCPGPNKSIEIESDRGTFIKRMHSTQIGRIDGLTELYKDYDAKIGDNARVCFISKDKISISFSKGEDIFEKENREFSERTTLSETIERNRELCQTKTHLFCYNETNVRIELIEPILNALGWSIPDLAREIKCKDTSLKVDFALFKNNKCVLIIEAKSIDKALPQNPEDPNEKQLRKYLEDSRFNNAKYGILTNGQVWQIRNKNGKILRSIDILTNGKEDVAEKEIKEFFDLFKKDIDFDKQEEIAPEIRPHHEANDRTAAFKIVRKEGLDILGKNPTTTFRNFIDEYPDEIKKLQDQNRFGVKVISEIDEGLRNSKKGIKQLNGKMYYITGDHSTYLKRMIIQQIIDELNLEARIETID